MIGDDDVCDGIKEKPNLTLGMIKLKAQPNVSQFSVESVIWRWRLLTITSNVRSNQFFQRFRRNLLYIESHIKLNMCYGQITLYNT